MMYDMIETRTRNCDEGTQHFFQLIVDELEVGCATVIDYENGTCLIERIDIDEEHRNHGYGTHFINAISDTFGSAYLAADSEDSARLYDRIGFDVTSDDVWGYLDEGYGVYRV